jgi:hypothetical protein
VKAKWIFLFWGALDLFYIGRFSYVNYAEGRIPFYSDVQSFVALAPEHGSVSVLLFLLSAVLNVSVIVSAFLLFFKQRSARIFICFQTPLRLLLVVPSLSFLPWLINISGVISAVLLVGLLVMSEIIKVLSIIFAKRITASG